MLQFMPHKKISVPDVCTYLQTALYFDETVFLAGTWSKPPIPIESHKHGDLWLKTKCTNTKLSCKYGGHYTCFLWRGAHCIGCDHWPTPLSYLDCHQRLWYNGYPPTFFSITKCQLTDFKQDGLWGTHQSIIGVSSTPSLTPILWLNDDNLQKINSFVQNFSVSKV